MDTYYIPDCIFAMTWCFIKACWTYKDINSSVFPSLHSYTDATIMSLVCQLVASQGLGSWQILALNLS